jgi:hypothetical protein
MREESKRRHLSPMNVENASLLRRSSRIDAKKASQNEESSFERRLGVDKTLQCRQNEDKSNTESNSERRLNVEGTLQCLQNANKTSQCLQNEDKTSQSRKNEEKSNTECRINVTDNVEKMGRRKNVTSNVENMGRRKNFETMGRRQIEKRPKKRRQLRTMTTIHIRPDFAQRETVEVRV